MVKRVALLILPMILLANPLGAQSIEIGFGYANWGVNVDADTTERAHGFASNQTINFNDWFALDNYLGAYSFPSINTTAGRLDMTAIYNIIGVKLTARDLLDGAMSPFVVAGFGGGSVSDQGIGFSSVAARYGGGVDFPLNTGFTFRVEATNMAVSESFEVLTTGDESWASNFNVATSIVFNLGGF